MQFTLFVQKINSKGRWSPNMFRRVLPQYKEVVIHGDPSWAVLARILTYFVRVRIKSKSLSYPVWPLKRLRKRRTKKK